MNILNKLTITNLKMNKKRTMVTIVGIVLATALITAVAGMLTSFKATMIERAKENTGNYHFVYKDVPVNELKYIENNRNVQQYYITSKLGYAAFDESQNADKKYFALYGFTEKAMTDSSIKLIDGKMPENDSEIVISKHIITNGKANYQIGDTLTLDVGDRVSADGEVLSQSDPMSTDEQEKIQTKFRKQYTIVGIIERPNTSFEYYMAPGYTIITYFDNNVVTGNADIYTLYTKAALKNKDAVTAEILGVDAELVKKAFSRTEFTKEEREAYKQAKYEISDNPALIRWQMNNFSDSTMSMIKTVSIVVILVIMFTSIFCIRNSFEISITEKKRQYGMLSSVGATSKQIRKNVLYEGFLLGIFGIPIGICCGIFAVFVLLRVVQRILYSYLDGIQFIFHVSWLAIVFAVLLSIVTIYFSAIKSARKAAKVTPIEAIRSNQDIKIKANKLHSPGIIKKIFGIGGEIAYKNLKRNRKKYRTTVVSIVVSVGIFIAIASFIGYAFNTSSVYYSVKNYNLSLHMSLEKDDSFLTELPNMENVGSYSIQRHMSLNVPIDQLNYSDKGKENLQAELKMQYERTDSDSADENSAENSDENSAEKTAELEKQKSTRNLPITSLGEEEYKKFLAKVGVEYEDAKDKAILIDEQQTYVSENGTNGNYQRYQVYNYKAGDSVAGSITSNLKQEEMLTLEIAAVTIERPMGMENEFTTDGTFVVSDEFMKQHQDALYPNVSIYVQSGNPDALEAELNQTYPQVSVYNVAKSVNSEKALLLVISIFLYGFITVISLIGITNIFNTITTSMSLRSKEFAMLKSVGITRKEFNRMIRLETLFYGVKSLVVGIPIGVLLSCALYFGFKENTDFGYQFPFAGVLISIVAVFILISGIMHYSLSKINKQNIIETIRKDNI